MGGWGGVESGSRGGGGWLNTFFSILCHLLEVLLVLIDTILSNFM